MIAASSSVDSIAARFINAAGGAPIRWDAYSMIWEGSPVIGSYFYIIAADATRYEISAVVAFREGWFEVPTSTPENRDHCQKLARAAAAHAGCGVADFVRAIATHP